MKKILFFAVVLVLSSFIISCEDEQFDEISQSQIIEIESTGDDEGKVGEEPERPGQCGCN